MMDFSVTATRLTEFGAAAFGSVTFAEATGAIATYFTVADVLYSSGVAPVIFLNITMNDEALL